MKYKLQDLIDMEHFQNLQDRLNEIYSFPSAIIDNKGNILSATAWQDICTQFHRKNRECELDCIQSDQYIQSHLHEANPAVSYRCPRGLVDNATPIIIDGIHYGNFFTGQFFLEKPDMEFFRKQAKKYGFDEKAYLAAVKKVPIWTQEQLNSYLFFIKGLIAVISESGLKKLKEVEVRKQFEESEQRNRTILHTAMDGFWVVDLQGHLLEVNKTYCLMSGYSAQELLAMRITDLRDAETEDSTALHIQKIIEQGEDRFESRHRRKDGSIFEVELSVQYRPTAGGQIVAFLRDVTERKQAEKALEESEVKLRTIFESSIDAIGVSKDGIQTFMNQSYLSLFGYSNTNELINQPVLNLVAPSEHEIILERVRSHTKGEVFASQYESRGRRKDGTEFDMDVHVSVYELAGETYSLVILRDISERKQAEKALRDTLESLRKAMSTTIQVMVSTVEARDPYTAGHQLNSANLARAIATEMGLPPEKIEGLRMAGSIHDIGKISIPAEILSKPTKLSEIEFALIKEHAQRGFEMLKDVESPWPLAEIVYQHHERMDGSGYPRQLKGEEICVEARILTVADVVEAMASHRPYRAGLGIDAALNEIEKNKGIFYDNKVADACLKLFREQDFVLEVS